MSHNEIKYVEFAIKKVYLKGVRYTLNRDLRKL